MATTATSSWRRTSDHFEPHDITPEEQRRIRGALEAMDYTAYACNREVMAAHVGKVDAARVQRLAVATAQARARWVAETLKMSDAGALGTEHAQRLSALRRTYEELSEAYDALRRLIERGYVAFTPAG